MIMTHYMELLAVNQPWNLIIFMAIPVILAETIAITELWILFTRKFNGLIRDINRIAGILGGLYFLGIFFYLFGNVFIPLTISGEWRGFVDFIAVAFYLLGVVPLMGITLLELGFLKKGKSNEDKLKLHAIFVGIFLLIAHIAMIFGMLNPEVVGYKSNELKTEIPSEYMEHDM
jgi:hypothetical protein